VTRDGETNTRPGNNGEAHRSDLQPKAFAKCFLRDILSEHFRVLALTLQAIKSTCYL
jgi:hypothetical protein